MQHTRVSNSLHQTTLFPSSSGRQAIHIPHTTPITQNIVPLNFPHEQTFGNPLDCAKPTGHIYLAFSNIAGFPFDVYNRSEVQDLRAFQTQFQVDIFGGCESNLNWKIMPPAGRLYKWFCSPNPLQVITGHNIHDNFGQQQFGSTFLLSHGEITSSISTTGSDPSSLGCWAWFALSGRTGITTCTISAYHPSKSSLNQINSVQAQHPSARVTPVNLEWPSCMILVLQSQLGKQQETTLSSWPT